MIKFQYCPKCGQEKKNEDWVICPYCGNAYEEEIINQVDMQNDQTVDENMVDIDQLVKQNIHRYIVNDASKATDTIKYPTPSVEESRKEKISLSQQLNENLNKKTERKLSEIEKKKIAIGKRRRRIGAIIGAIIAILAISSLPDIEPIQYITIWLPVTLMFAGVGYGIATLFGNDPWI